MPPDLVPLAVARARSLTAEAVLAMPEEHALNELDWLSVESAGIRWKESEAAERREAAEAVRGW